MRTIRLYCNYVSGIVFLRCVIIYFLICFSDTLIVDIEIRVRSHNKPPYRYQESCRSNLSQIDLSSYVPFPYFVSIRCYLFPCKNSSHIFTSSTLPRNTGVC